MFPSHPKKSEDVIPSVATGFGAVFAISLSTSLFVYRSLIAVLIVVTSETIRSLTAFDDGIAFANQYNEKNQLEDEVIIIGGAQIFNETLPIMNRLVLTQVDCEIAGDVFYPEINMNNFIRKSVSKHFKDEKNQFDFSIDLYEKI